MGAPPSSPAGGYSPRDWFNYLTQDAFLDIDYRSLNNQSMMIHASLPLFTMLVNTGHYDLNAYTPLPQGNSSVWPAPTYTNLTDVTTGDLEGLEGYAVAPHRLHWKSWEDRPIHIAIWARRADIVGLLLKNPTVDKFARNAVFRRGTGTFALNAFIRFKPWDWAQFLRQQMKDGPAKWKMVVAMLNESVDTESESEEEWKWFTNVSRMGVI